MMAAALVLVGAGSVVVADGALSVAEAVGSLLAEVVVSESSPGGVAFSLPHFSWLSLQTCWPSASSG